jgi:hypothetical protein
MHLSLLNLSSQTQPRDMVPFGVHRPLSGAAERGRSIFLYVWFNVKYTIALMQELQLKAGI